MAKVRETLKQIGFSWLPIDLEANGGSLVWNMRGYRVNVEFSRGRRMAIHDAGVERVLGLVLYDEGVDIENVHGLVSYRYFGYVWKIVQFELYIIYLSTLSFANEFDISVYDQNLEKIAQISVPDGFLGCGSQHEISKMLTKLMRETNSRIVLY
jgi:hypothetical protein